LRQGDYLTGCHVPVLPEDYGRELRSMRRIRLDAGDMIVMTQSCDLEQRKVSVVALCPIWPVTTYEAIHIGPSASRREWTARWNNVRRGREPGLHLLASPSEPNNAWAALVVDFRVIYSLPYGYLSRLAADSGPRWRLNSPYLEHFSQAFARFFMRVGLPSNVAEFK
jgi:hypothetical protein